MEPEEDARADEIEQYGDEYIASKDAPVPRWLKFNYIIWPLFGIVWMYYFWNGSYGWLDRGYWQQLQRAAQTTYPYNVKEDFSKNDNIPHVIPVDKAKK